MELVEGPTLANRIAQGPVPLAEALPIARQIAEALEAAHDRGIIHRDLKPANVKVREDGTAKVLDFGLAAVAQPASPLDANLSNSPTISAVTQTGVILGTASYMSPEQARGKSVDKRADIWAFGVVLYEMLCGRRLFIGDTITDVLSAIISREPDWTLLPAETPAAVRKLLERCLEKDPHRRLRDIGEARVGLSDPSLVSAPARMHETPPVIPSRRRPVVWIALLAGLLTGAIVAAVAIRQLVRSDGSGAASASTPGSSPSRLLVFPFENLSRQAADEWLAGAFSDSLTGAMRDAENIVLVNRERLLELNQSRNSDLQQVARGMGVRFYVSGSYQRVGDDLRVVARLVGVENGTIKVQESLTDRFVNLLRIEDDLAHRFAAALERSPAAAKRIQTASLPAYQSVAQANDLYFNGRFPEAIQQLEAATSQDENYADAWALLGKSYAQLSAPSNLDRSTRSELLDKALRASQRAIELSPSLYEAQLALGASYQQLEQVESWRIAAQKAIDLNPRLAEGYVLLGDSYGASPAFGCARRRDPELAERSYKKALQLNPSFGSAHARLATSYFWAGRDKDALRQLDEALLLLPQNIQIQRARAAALGWLGRADELEQQLQRLGTLATPNILDKYFVSVISLLRGNPESAAKGFQAAIEAGPVNVREIDTARIYAQVGRMKDAVDHLQHAFALDSSCAVFVSENPVFAVYKNDPNLKALLTQYLGKNSLPH